MVETLMDLDLKKANYYRLIQIYGNLWAMAVSDAGSSKAGLDADGADDATHGDPYRY
jgi:hypothetical protein